MRIRAIAPLHLDDAEISRRQQRFDRLAPPGIRITAQNLPDASDVPRQLASADDIAASDAAVTATLHDLDPDEVDLALPDCVLDPGIPARGTLEVPTHGITELAAGVVAATGAAFTAVARNRAIADELDAVIERYGYRGFAPTRVLDLSFEAIADDAVWNDTVAAMTRELASTPFRRVLNGCSAVDVRDDGSGVTVFDPTRLALDALRVAADHGLITHEERGDHG